MDAVFYIALTLTVFLIVALLAAPVMLRPSKAARRIMEMVQSNRPDERNVSSQERMRETILSLASSLWIRFGLAEDEEVKQLLLSAGVRSTRGMNAYFASRILGPIFGLICGSFIQSHTLFWSLSLAAVFYLIPDMWLRIRIKQRRERIRRGLPDALDLLVICVEAGLGLDQAMLRVGQELVIGHPDIHQEFMQVNLSSLPASLPGSMEKHSGAHTNCGVPLFVSMLTQADRFGTPIVRALSRFGDEIRLKKAATGRGDGCESQNQDTLSPRIFYISLHFHCFAGTRVYEHRQEHEGI